MQKSAQNVLVYFDYRFILFIKSLAISPSFLSKSDVIVSVEYKRVYSFSSIIFFTGMCRICRT